MKIKNVILSIIIFIIVCLVIFLILNKSSNKNVDIYIENIIDNVKEYKLTEIDIVKGTEIGTLTIPKIGLYDIKICESVELDVLSYSIGHFESTNIFEGNIGLASHNSGSNANYFENIHLLENGDEIYYNSFYGTKKYSVNNVSQIDSYDWSNLEQFGDNRITLITCIPNNPNLRLCVKAIEIN